MKGRLVLIGVLIITLLIQGAPALAQQDLRGGIQDLVRQMVAGMEQQQKRKLAILDFAKLDGSVDNLTRYLTEQLATHMVIARRNFDVIERKHLDKILAEQGLNLSGIIEPQNAKQVGRLSGVDAIATGTVTDLQTALEVSARLIDTETGKVFAAAITRFTKDREVLALLGREGQRLEAEKGLLEERKTLEAQRQAEVQRKGLEKEASLKLIREAIEASGSKQTAATSDYVQGSICFSVNSGGGCAQRDIATIPHADIERIYSIRKSWSYSANTIDLCAKIADMNLRDSALRQWKGSSCLRISWRSDSPEVEKVKEAMEVLAGKKFQ